MTDSAILFNCLLSFAKYGMVKMGPDDKSNKAIKTLLDNFSLIKKAVVTEKSYDRQKLKNEIFCFLYTFLRDEEKDRENEQNDSGNSKESNDSGSGNSDSDNGGNSDSNSANESDKSDGNGNSDDDNFSNDTNSDSSESDNSSFEDTLDDVLNNVPETTNIDENVDSGTGSVLHDKNIKDSSSSTQNGLSKQQKFDSMMNGDDSEDSQIPSPSDMREVDTIAEEIAKDEVMAEAEKELAENLKDEAENLNYGNINRNAHVSVSRNLPSSAAYEIYKRDFEEIKGISTRMVREIRNKIKDQQNGGKLNGLYNGRYLDSRSLYRFDMRCMARNDLPEDIPDMAISLMIDCSGSMGGQNLENARKTAQIIYQFGKELNIPVSVYGHNCSGYGDVSVSSLADFNSVDNNDQYRICDISAHGCNRDGMALRFASEQLLKRNEKNKFVIIISDGLPSAYYSENEGYADIRDVLMTYSKQGVRYMTFGLGYEQNRIEQLYCQNLSRQVAARFIATNKPDELPINVVKAIKELIKV